MRAAELRVFWSLQAYATYLSVSVIGRRENERKKRGKRRGGEEEDKRERLTTPAGLEEKSVLLIFAYSFTRYTGLTHSRSPTQDSAALICIHFHLISP